MVPYISPYFISTSHIFPVVSISVKPHHIARWPPSPILLDLDSGWGRVLTVEARHTPGSQACFRIAANNWNIFHSTQTKSILNSTSLNWVLKMSTVISHQYTQGGVPTVWVIEEGAVDLTDRNESILILQN